MEELDKKQVREDLEMMAKKLVEATQSIKEVYERIIEIYEGIKETNQEVSKY